MLSISRYSSKQDVLWFCKMKRTMVYKARGGFAVDVYLAKGKPQTEIKIILV